VSLGLGKKKKNAACSGEAREKEWNYVARRKEKKRRREVSRNALRNIGKGELTGNDLRKGDKGI